MDIFENYYRENGEKEKILYLFLAKTLCIPESVYKRILERYGCLSEFYKAGEEELSKAQIFTAKQSERIFALKRNYDPEKEYALLEKQGVRMLPFYDREFPEKLREIHDAPPVIFLKGKLPDTDRPAIAVIGARECSMYGTRVAERIGELMALNGISLISGMARGIDAYSQAAALNAGGYSCAVLGGGIDCIYPRESAKLYENLADKGGIISEYPPGVTPQKLFFAKRNRLISGIADGVCVVEAREKSGTLITVDCALEQGRDVYAVPGRISDVTSSGCNALIKQGAYMVNDPKLLMEEIYRDQSFIRHEIRLPEKEKEKLTEKEGKFLLGLEEESFNSGEICQKCGLGLQDFFEICLGLSEKGLIKNLGAGRFALTEKGLDLRNMLAGSEDDE